MRGLEAPCRPLRQPEAPYLPAASWFWSVGVERGSTGTQEEHTVKHAVGFSSVGHNVPAKDPPSEVILSDDTHQEGL